MNATEEYTLWHALTCSGGNWLPTNHLLFHLANICLFLTYTTPPGLAGVMFLRVVLAFGCFFFTVWGWFVLCALDTIIWNALFTVINVIHIFVLLIVMRPVKLPDDVKASLSKVLGPYNVGEGQFQRLYEQCSQKMLRLRKNEVYAMGQTTRADRVTLILSGEVCLSHPDNKGDDIIIGKNHFIEAIEWFDNSKVPVYQRTVRATEITHVMIWDMEELRRTFVLCEDHTGAALEAAMAKDFVGMVKSMRTFH